MPSYEARPLEELASRARRLGPYRAELNRLRSRNVNFAKEGDFRGWFERHFKLLGFRRVILSQRDCPDLILEDLGGEPVRVELERDTSGFREHKHDPKAVDMVIAVSGTESLPIPSYALGAEFGTSDIVLRLSRGRMNEIRRTAVEDYRSITNQLHYLFDLGLETRNRNRATERMALTIQGEVRAPRAQGRSP
jgi:hypothetical protein